MDPSVSSKIEEFFDQYRLRKYAKGQVLILNGDETDYVYHLISGKVKQYDVSYRGDEIILNIFKPPAFFPMSLAINKLPNPYIYEAETDIEIRQAPAEEVVAFLKENPDVAFDLLSRVYRGLDGLIGRMAHLMSGSAKSRLLYELVIEARRFGEDRSDGSRVIKLNEKDLGARAGMSRETVNREIRKLKTAGLLTIGKNDIVINDMAALEAAMNREI
jgi:CRP/FNR family transcriptional regulator